MVVGFTISRGITANARELLEARRVKELAAHSLALVLAQDDVTKEILLDVERISEANRKIEAYDQNRAILRELATLSASEELSGVLREMDRIDEEELRPLDALVLETLMAEGAEAAQRAYFSRYEPVRRRYQDLARELIWRLHSELLELPYDDGRRRTAKDALAEAILADPRVAAAVDVLAAAGRHAHDPDRQARLRRILERYAGTRAAAADLVNNVLLASAGMVAFQKLTPGTLTLGPVIAATLAQQAAVASFPLGAGLGSIWYGLFPAAPSAGLVAGATGGLVLLTASTAAFAGVIADPVQRAFGLHQRRLHRMIDAIGRELEGDSDAAFHARDHYVARIFDLIDLARATYRAI